MILARPLALGTLVSIVVLATPADSPAQTSTATITVDGTFTEVLSGPSVFSAWGLHQLGPIRIQSYSWTAQLDASGGYAWHLRAKFMNDLELDNDPHTIVIDQTAGLVGGLRRWYSTYNGMAFESPGPGGGASDGTLRLDPNICMTWVGGAPLGDFSLPINITPSPVAEPYSSTAGPLTMDSSEGTAHLEMTLGPGDVNDITSTVSIYSPTPVPMFSLIGQLILVALISAVALFTLRFRTA